MKYIKRALLRIAVTLVARRIEGLMQYHEKQQDLNNEAATVDAITERKAREHEHLSSVVNKAQRIIDEQRAILRDANTRLADLSEKYVRVRANHLEHAHNHGQEYNALLDVKIQVMNLD